MTLLSDQFCRTMWLLSTSGQAVDPTEAAEQRALEMLLERTLAYVTGLTNVRTMMTILIPVIVGGSIGLTGGEYPDRGTHRQGRLRCSRSPRFYLRGRI